MPIYSWMVLSACPGWKRVAGQRGPHCSNILKFADASSACHAWDSSGSRISHTYMPHSQTAWHSLQNTLQNIHTYSIIQFKKRTLGSHEDSRFWHAKSHVTSHSLVAVTIPWPCLSNGWAPQLHLSISIQRGGRRCSILHHTCTVHVADYIQKYIFITLYISSSLWTFAYPPILTNIFDALNFLCVFICNSILIVSYLFNLIGLLFIVCTKRQGTFFVSVNLLHNNNYSPSLVRQ